MAGFNPSDDANGSGSMDGGAVRYSVEFLGGIIDTLADPVFVKDRKHRWVILNQAFCQFMGYPRELLLGKSDHDFFPPDEAAVFWARDDRVFQEEREDVNEELFTDSAGTTHVIVTKKAVFQDERGDRYLVGVIRDITELRHAQEALVLHQESLEDLVRQRTLELSDANARLLLEIQERQRSEDERRRLESHMQQVQKLESLGILAGGIAHDFNNLLAGILGNADLALGSLDGAAPAHRFVQEIRKAAMRSASLTNQMLAYSGRGRFLVEVVDLNEIVHDLSELLEAGATRKAIRRFCLGEDLPPVKVDVAQIRQVVMNLITNATESITDSSGVVAISTRIEKHAGGPVPDAVLDGDLAPGRYVCLEVVDTGCGMDDETRTRIFDPFFTTKGAGRGLGLAAVLGIVRGHGGVVTLQSSAGKGTTIRVLLPSADGVVESSASNGDRVPTEASADGGRVLVVDDDGMVRNMISTMLKVAGFDAVGARDGKDAIELFTQHAGKLDLVILDLTMPAMGGAEVLGELRLLSPDIPVLLTSGYSEHDALIGADDFIQKPFTFENLISKVKSLLGSKGRNLHA